MVFVVSTACLVVALTANHIVHGFGCWGLQPGGRTSALIYDLQILTALISLVWLAIVLSASRKPVNPNRLIMIGCCVVASVIMFMVTGWKAHTSIHYQGAENILAFLPVVFTSLAAGAYDWPPLPKPSRRFWQFSLRTLFVLLTALCVWLGWTVHRTNEQRKAVERAVEWVGEMGGRVYREANIVRGVSLANTTVNDLTPLAGLTNLRVLDLNNTQVSEDQVKEIRKRLLKCHIVWSPPDPSP